MTSAEDYFSGTAENENTPHDLTQGTPAAHGSFWKARPKGWRRRFARDVRIMTPGIALAVCTGTVLWAAGAVESLLVQAGDGFVMQGVLPAVSAAASPPSVSADGSSPGGSRSDATSGPEVRIEIRPGTHSTDCPRSVLFHDLE